MVVTPADREELVRRVTRKVAHRVDGALVRSAVDRVADALGREVASDEPQLVIASAQSQPDLASRLRAAVPDVGLGKLAVASEGRHTVVVAEVGGDAVERVRSAAIAMGASVTVRNRA